jgi:hypothetical protein
MVFGSLKEDVDEVVYEPTIGLGGDGGGYYDHGG